MPHFCPEKVLVECLRWVIHVDFAMSASRLLCPR